MCKADVQKETLFFSTLMWLLCLYPSCFTVSTGHGMMIAAHLASFEVNILTQNYSDQLYLISSRTSFMRDNASQYLEEGATDEAAACAYLARSMYDDFCQYLHPAHLSLLCLHAALHNRGSVCAVAAAWLKLQAGKIIV